jgi:hypothetical protein
MISSEVQRTLVKSPPELWSELSDETALARHLGEFGEVRITRRTPEERIEWEAPQARGSIHLKPSGWGTRVTLTLERADTPSDAPAPPAIAPEPTAASGPAPAPQSDPPPAPEPQASAPEPQAAAPEPNASAPEQEPAPEVQDTPAPAAEPPAQISMPEQRPEADAERQLDAERDEATTSAAALAPASRRGFFKRLLDRWRAELGPINGALPVNGALPIPREQRQVVGEDIADASAARASASAAGPLESKTTDAPTTARPPGEGAEPQPTPTADAIGQALGTPPSDGASPLALPSPRTDTAEQHDEKATPADTTTPAPAPAPADISTELRAAEEAATDGDTLALRAVLDSLGSAHHRPFSRA